MNKIIISEKNPEMVEKVGTIIRQFHNGDRQDIQKSINSLNEQLVNDRSKSLLDISHRKLTYRDLQASQYYDEIIGVYKRLGGILQVIPCNLKKGDIELPDIIVELDEEQHFNIGWEAVDIANGARSLQELHTRVYKYRKTNRLSDSDPSIECIILAAPFYFDEKDWIPVPDWGKSIVQGKIYDTNQTVG